MPYLGTGRVVTWMALKLAQSRKATSVQHLLQTLHVVSEYAYSGHQRLRERTRTARRVLALVDKAYFVRTPEQVYQLCELGAAQCSDLLRAFEGIGSEAANFRVATRSRRPAGVVIGTFRSGWGHRRSRTCSTWTSGCSATCRNVAA